MIPVRLFIKGMYSYNNSVEIDFEKLTKARIFGIFGQVGSGKSTILEAISFVLYGQSTRLSNRDNVSYNMMNLKANEMEIDFEFLHLDKKYRFTYLAKRNSKQQNKISKHERKGYIWNGNEWEPLPSNNAENILNLKYEDFRRIVIIPQGMFNDFVQLKPDERTTMLKDLFMLDKYDLFDATKELDKICQEEIIATNAELIALQHINEEEIKNLSSQIQELNFQEKSKTKELNSQIEELNLWEKILDKQSNLDELKKEYLIFKQKDDSIQELKKRTEKYQKYFHSLSSLNDKIQNSKNDQKSLEGAALKNKNEIHSLLENIKNISYKQQLLEAKYGNSDAQKELLKAANIALEIQHLEHQHSLCDKEIEQFQSSYIIIENQIKESEQKEIIIKSKMEDLQNILLEESSANHFLHLIAVKKRIQNELTSKTNELSLWNDSISKIHLEKNTILSKIQPLTNKNLTELDANQLKNHISDSIQFEQKNIEEFQNKKLEIVKKNTLEDFASNLENGCPCPLCGSLEHPLPFSLSNANKEIESINKHLKISETNFQTLNNVSISLENLILNFRKDKAQINNIQVKVKELEFEISELEKELYSLKNYSEDSIFSTIEHINNAKNEYLQLQSELKLLNTLELKEKIEKVRSKTQEILNKKIKFETLIEEKKLQISILEQFEDTSDYSSLKQLLQSQILQLDEIYSEQNKLQNDLIILEERERQYSSNLKNLENTNSALENQWILLLQEFELAEHQALEIVNYDIDLEKDTEKINNYFQIKNNLESKIDELNQFLNQFPYDQDRHNSIKKNQIELREIIQNILQEIGAKNSQLNIQKSSIIHKNKLADKLIKTEERVDKLKLFLNLFKGQGFVKFRSNYLLKQLFALANQRFTAFTQHQLELHVDDENNFWVIDHLNEGHMRLLKTLSGGQTFQASLSLALALSEQIQNIHKMGQQFFFIDEGFGSLDKDSLNTVMDTLKQILNEGRIVGLVSHLEDLQNEIDYSIYVTKDPIQGSTIQLNY